MTLSTTGTTVLEGPGRHLKQDQQVWRDQRGCLQHENKSGGAREDSNRRRNMA